MNISINNIIIDINNMTSNIIILLPQPLVGQVRIRFHKWNLNVMMVV